MENRPRLSDREQIDEYVQSQGHLDELDNVNYEEKARGNPESVAAVVMYILYELSQEYPDYRVEPDNGNFAKERPGVYISKRLGSNADPLSKDEMREVCEEYGLTKCSRSGFFTLDEFADPSADDWREL